jgi:H+/Cl- antiporter ClcA
MVLISFLAAGIGLLAGLIAFVLYKLIGLFTNIFFYHHFATEFLSARHNQLGLWVIPIPVIGGIIVGFMAKYGTSKIKGHGIPEAMEAVMVNRSRIEPRVAILKPISAAIAIGTGGPFGAEGPIIQTGGAVGSLVGQAFHTTASERKVLLACGAAAGMSATFNTPIAGVILAIELLLFEFKARSFIPLVIASTLATAVHMQLLGAGPMFKVTAMDFGIPHALPFYLLLGLVCGLAAVGFSKLLYWTEDQFEKLPIDELWWPAMGALGLGIIGYFVPRVLGVGYDTIGDILNANLAWKLLLVVMAAKAVALVISLGSGTSGGLLAPMFMSSAAMGRGVRHGRGSNFPRSESVRGSFRPGRDGSGFRRGVAGYVLFHHFCLRNHTRLQLSAALDVGQCDCGWHCDVAHAEGFDHDRKTGAAGAAHPSGVRSGRAAAGPGFRDHGSRRTQGSRCHESQRVDGLDRTARSFGQSAPRNAYPGLRWQPGGRNYTRRRDARARCGPKRSFDGPRGRYARRCGYLFRRDVVRRLRENVAQQHWPPAGCGPQGFSEGGWLSGSPRDYGCPFAPPGRRAR